ncbi:hypothetical protein T07_14836 [Trichinella nelsoni]|uniref:NadR/Ttd14 AAA domain-containing protein n=1 Tax=Trichinella nelsoni TaxID=6336 RepID=A0A0V0SIL4_9BILA|nr:hypothetical protein T07_14836 [Trichinella nelsoni]
MNVSDLEPFEPPPNLTSPEVVKAYKDFDIAIHRMKEDMHRAIKSQMADASGNDERTEARECSGRRTADSTPVKSRKRAKDKEKKIIFELCQKSFELRQVHGNYSLYRLSRIWMYGNDEPRHVNKAGNETTEEEPIDGTAQTRAAELEKSDASLVKWNEPNTEICSLPPPSPSTSPISRIPPTVVMNETDDADVDLSTPQRILQSYLPHWKEVKKAWLRQSRLADRPYQKSLDMLKLIAAGILFVCQTCKMIRNGDERKVYKVVLTGGPCSGKTTGQEFLASFFEAIGWKVFRVPELATIIGGARFNELNEEQVMRFQENLLLTLLRLEDSFMSLAETCGENCLVICDRGAMDGSAYLNREAWEEILRRNNLNPIALRDQRYNQIVHLVSAAVGAENFYHCSTALRLESLEEAREVEHRTRHVWVGHPYMDIIDNENCKTFRDKMLKMAQVICDRAGVEYGDRLAPNSIKRKFLVSNFDLSQCKDYQEFDVVHECVRSDMGQTWIRRRGQNGNVVIISNWLYTINERRVVDGVPVETKALLSRREYEMLRAHVDPATYPTFKKRLCFVYAHHYYQLDVFVEPCPKRCHDLKILVTYTTNTTGNLPVPTFITVSKEVTRDTQYSLYNLCKRDVVT